ncbi:NfeD family protein [Lentilactobacillus buchneri]|uniref:Uncharacterized protein n=1 Tax=Lentilactobacillus buchneri DSM 20057 TaxID=1423728 RepID=A0A4R5NQX3_LENBU|nr:hypothetical protein [Lentilactobacillus buchneri]WCJ52513.1 hypothetical protein OKF32_04125 [Lentilactobacillus sp. Egmn17]AEB74262.1 hypothetical protein Lbuc_2016 [Lentilactobacillus buchneri NRRL B-30929]KRK69603.1 hypothetical protein FC79_GL000826 [Lentilactobacillus buchneri DSM 20057]MCT2881656.1 hypothetical protein [Lentilactobacillus buchneri]MCT2898567.1 hypothetical protein [Lentilactobacillus buchneri]
MSYNNNFYREPAFWLSICAAAVGLMSLFLGNAVQYSIIWWLQLLIVVIALIGIFYFFSKYSKDQDNKNKHL